MSGDLRQDQVEWVSRKIGKDEGVPFDILRKEQGRNMDLHKPIK